MRGRIVAALIIILICSGCSKKQDPKPEEARPLSIKEVEISGDWKNYVKIEDGDYLLEDNGANFGGMMLITPKLELKKTWDGVSTASDTFRLVPLSPGGTELQGHDFMVASTANEKFNDFVKGKPGDKASITFSASFNRRKESDREFFKKISGIAGITVAPAKTQNAAAVTSASESQTGTTAAAPKQEPVRSGPRTIAVPDLTGAGAVGAAQMAAINGAITAGLLKNGNVKKVIDYNQIALIMKQHQFEASDWSNPAKYAALGKAFNIDTIVIGQVSQEKNPLYALSGGGYTVSLQLIDVNTMELAGAFSGQGTADAIQSTISKMTIRKLGD